MEKIILCISYCIYQILIYDAVVLKSSPKVAAIQFYAKQYLHVKDVKLTSYPVDSVEQVEAAVRSAGMEIVVGLESEAIGHVTMSKWPLNEAEVVELRMAGGQVVVG